MFPDLAKKVMDFWVGRRKRIREEKQRRDRVQLRELVARAVRSLKNAGKYPSRRRIQRKLYEEGLPTDRGHNRLIQEIKSEIDASVEQRTKKTTT
jgi:hypothetical protein